MKNLLLFFCFIRVNGVNPKIETRQKDALFNEWRHNGPELSAQQRQDELLGIEDVLGKRIVSTRLHRTVTILEENATAALEVMSRFLRIRSNSSICRRLSPSKTTGKEGYLEYPTEAFAYYQHEGAGAVVCQQKHISFTERNTSARTT